MKKRVLFVDDEQNILQGLKRMLRPFLSEWDISFANSGQEALEIIKKTPEIECIISDMRMPGMDGATLLTKVHELKPDMARFILSGHAELEPIMQAIPVTHQFLAKPCDSNKLIEAVRRACDLNNMITNPELKKILGKIESLPARPEVYAELTRVIADPNSCMEDIAEIVEKDPAISSKLLQVVNSAFFGLAQNMSKIKDAVSYLGITMIKNLVLSQEVIKQFNIGNRFAGYSVEDENKRSLLVANIAKRLLPEKRQSEDAFMAGILQSVGRLIIAQYLPDKFELILAQFKNSDATIYEIEKEHLGVTNGQLGAYLLGLWGLPYPIVEAVAYHHAPWEVEHTGFQIIDAVYLANCFLDERKSPNNQSIINMDHLEKLNVAYAISEWREIAVGFLEKSAE